MKRRNAAEGVGGLDDHPESGPPATVDEVAIEPAPWSHRGSALE